MRNLLLTLLLYALLPFAAIAQQQNGEAYHTKIWDLGLNYGQYVEKASYEARHHEILISQRYRHIVEKNHQLRYFNEEFLAGLHSHYKTLPSFTPNGNLKLNLGFAFTFNILGSERDNFRMWAGGSINNHFAILVNSSYYPTYFQSLYLGGDVVMRYRFYGIELNSFIKLPLVSLNCRPSFSIIGETVTQQDDISSFLKGTKTYIKGLGGFSCDLGISWNTRKGVPQRISYKWEYYSAGNRSPWEYKEAIHSIYYTIRIKEGLGR